MAIRDNLRRKIIVSGGGTSSGGSSDSGTGGSGTSAIDGGFTVNFYNSDEVLIESHSALCGMYIDVPISYTAETWQNADGYVNSFPLTVSEDSETKVFDLYDKAAPLCDSVLYKVYGVDESVYPYIYTYYNHVVKVLYLYFKKTNGNGEVLQLTNSYTGEFDVHSVTKFLVQIAPSHALTTQTMNPGSDASNATFTNYECTEANGRLDETFYYG